MNNTDIAKQITEKFIAAIEAGTAPWQKSWTGEAGAPCNFITKRPYRGINALLLSMMPYSSPFWMTFNQAKAKGGSVRKGEKSTMVVFWKIIEKDQKDSDEKKKIFFLRYYRVFNLEQIDGIEVPALPESKSAAEKIEICEKMLATDRIASIRFGGGSAFYNPKLDYIQLPTLDQFASAEQFYCVAFHEAVHSTGHKSRLDREELVGIAASNRESYSKEELTAELGASFLCNAAGILNDVVFDNSASYLAGWLKMLKADPNLILSAASKAQRASDYILGASASLALDDEE